MFTSLSLVTSFMTLQGAEAMRRVSTGWRAIVNELLWHDLSHKVSIPFAVENLQYSTGLRLHYNDTTQIEDLPQLQSLVDLHVDWQMNDLTVLATLPAVPGLVKLTLSDARAVDPAGWRRLPQLQELTLHKKCDKALDFTHLTQLRVVRFGGRHGDSDHPRISCELAALPLLRHVSFMSGGGHMEPLAACSQIVELHSPTLWAGGGEQWFERLTGLTVSHCPLCMYRSWTAGRLMTQHSLH